MLVMLGALMLLGILAPEPLAIMLGALVFTVILLARLWTRAALIDVRYHVAASLDRLMVGEEFELSMVIENRKVLPIPWLRLTEYVPYGIDALKPDSLSAGQLNTTLRLAGYERIRLPRRLKALRRGVYRFGPARMVASDLFGFYETTGEAPYRSREVVVYPRIVPIGDFPLPPARPMGDDRSRRPMIVDPTRPAGIREYRSGDRPRDIDWKATAKHGELFVRTYEASVTGHVVILLDCMRSDSGRLATSVAMLEDCVSAAASLAVHLSGRGYAVGLVANGAAPGEAGPVIVPPARGPRQLAGVLKGLAGVSATLPDPLQEVIQTRGSAAIQYGCTIVYTTGLVQADTVACLHTLRAKGCATIVAYTGRADAPETRGIPLVDLRAVAGLLAPGEPQDGPR